MLSYFFIEKLSSQDEHIFIKSISIRRQFLQFLFQFSDSFVDDGVRVFVLGPARFYFCSFFRFLNSFGKPCAVSTFTKDVAVPELQCNIVVKIAFSKNINSKFIAYFHMAISSDLNLLTA